jgi:hypothetical protein
MYDGLRCAYSHFPFPDGPLSAVRCPFLDSLSIPHDAVQFRANPLLLLFLILILILILILLLKSEIVNRYSTFHNSPQISQIITDHNKKRHLGNGSTLG